MEVLIFLVNVIGLSFFHFGPRVTFRFSDLDLRKELSARSFSCGPIVGTTRSVYKKKLADMLLDEELPAEARIARAAPSSEDDDDEDEAEEVVVVSTRLTFS